MFTRVQSEEVARRRSEGKEIDGTVFISESRPRLRLALVDSEVFGLWDSTVIELDQDALAHFSRPRARRNTEASEFNLVLSAIPKRVGFFLNFSQLLSTPLNFALTFQAHKERDRRRLVALALETKVKLLT